MIKIAIIWGEFELWLISLQIKLKLMSGQFKPYERIKNENI
jgi:hypothetical protein